MVVGAGVLCCRAVSRMVIPFSGRAEPLIQRERLHSCRGFPSSLAPGCRGSNLRAEVCVLDAIASARCAGIVPV